jgi:protein CpxP
MKSYVLVIALLAATLVSGSLYSAVSAPLEGFGPDMAAENPDDRDPDGRGMAGERSFARMAEVLDLSDEQQRQIKAIRESEREKAAPLREALAENRQKLHEAIQAESFDEAAVRVLAASQAQARTELIVARARMQSRINAVLTPEQRVLAEKLRPLMKKGEGPRGRHHGLDEGKPRN